MSALVCRAAFRTCRRHHGRARSGRVGPCHRTDRRRGTGLTAGLDLKELGADTSNLGAANATEASQNPVMAIETCTKPVIGAINGVAITGGFEVALACDVLIASTNARFADTHARVGIMPGWGLSQSSRG